MNRTLKQAFDQLTAAMDDPGLAAAAAASAPPAIDELRALRERSALLLEAVGEAAAEAKRELNAALQRMIGFLSDGTPVGNPNAFLSAARAALEAAKHPAIDPTKVDDALEAIEALLRSDGVIDFYQSQPETIRKVLGALRTEASKLRRHAEDQALKEFRERLAATSRELAAATAELRKIASRMGEIRQGLSLVAKVLGVVAGIVDRLKGPLP